MEDQLGSVIVGGIALCLILAKIVRDELLRKHNPNFGTLDRKIDALSSQVHKLATSLALFHQDSANYRDRSLEYLKEIRDAVRDIPTP